MELLKLEAKFGWSKTARVVGGARCCARELVVEGPRSCRREKQAIYAATSNRRETRTKGEQMEVLEVEQRGHETGIGGEALVGEGG